MATTTAFLDNQNDNNPYPIANFFNNNVASEAWIHKVSKKSPAGKALSFLQAAIMIKNPVGIHADHISTTDNVIAHCISHFPNHSDHCPTSLPSHSNFCSYSIAIASTQVQS